MRLLMGKEGEEEGGRGQGQAPIPPASAQNASTAIPTLLRPGNPSPSFRLPGTADLSPQRPPRHPQLHSAIPRRKCYEQVPGTCASHTVPARGFRQDTKPPPGLSGARGCRNAAVIGPGDGGDAGGDRGAFRSRKHSLSSSACRSNEDAVLDLPGHEPVWFPAKPDVLHSIPIGA